LDARYAEEIDRFCADILQIRSTLDFQVSSRGWCYILEGRGLITKADFDACQTLINDCRKSGDLPLGICSMDGARAFGDNIEELDQTSVDEEAAAIMRYLNDAEAYYTPTSFWEERD
jgi:hypothetical protein